MSVSPRKATGSISKNLQNDEHLDDVETPLQAPFKTRRRGVETKIIVGDMKPAPDRTLLRGLAKAHRWVANLQEGIPIAEIARRENVSEAYIRTRVQLAFLSPKLQQAILDGTQPAGLTLEKLVRGQLPLDWTSQEQRFGNPREQAFPAT